MHKFPSETRRSGRHARMVVLAAAAATSLVAFSQARADTTDTLLDELRAKGVLTGGEYSKLKARHEAEKATMARTYGAHRMVTKNGVVVVPDDRYLTRLDKGIGFHIPGLITKEGETGAIDVKISGDLVFAGIESFKSHGSGTALFNPVTGGAGGVAGGLVTDSPFIAHNAISAGLLPSAIVLSIATNQMGYDLGFTIGAYTGGNNVGVGVAGCSSNANCGGAPHALGTPGIDLRQIFGTVGTPTFGTVKIGRDLGLFGSDAILNDATLLGVGSPLTTTAPRNTTLGRIGLGYIYADWIPQVTYTTPDFNGFTASIGAFTPLSTVPFGTTSFFAPGNPLGGSAPFAGSLSLQGAEVPMVQGQVKWKGAIAPGANLTLSADGLWAEHRNDSGSFAGIGFPFNSVAPGAAVDSWGVDGFGKLDVYGFSFVAYGYYGKGIGSTGFFFDAFSVDGGARTSFGGYAQAQYTWDKFTFGASWGISELQADSFDNFVGGLGPLSFAFYEPFMLKSNQSIIGYVRYQLTPWMALQGEYGHTWATNQSGGKLYDDDIALGTAWFF